MTSVNSNLVPYSLFLVYDTHITKRIYFVAFRFTLVLLFAENLYTVTCVNVVETGNYIWSGNQSLNAKRELKCTIK
jgi:hypothetical protein